MLTNSTQCGTGALWGIPVAISALGEEGLRSFGDHDSRAFPEFDDGDVADVRSVMENRGQKKAKTGDAGSASSAV